MIDEGIDEISADTQVQIPHQDEKGRNKNV